MYYYKFNIGDYAKCTRHLSNLEDLAYRRLLELYYSDELPLVNDIKKLSRLIMMRENEQEVVNVLDDFFFLEDDRWKQNRVEQELDEYRAKAETARGNGKLGGRPKKPSKNPIGSNKNPVGSKKNPGGSKKKPDSNPGITGLKANHKPLTTNQEPITINQEPGVSSNRPESDADSNINTMSDLENYEQMSLEQNGLVPIGTGECLSPFERFWDAYGKKDKRKDCEKKWKSKKLDPMIDHLLADIKNRDANCHNWRIENGIRKYKSGPLPYLNGELWNNEISPFPLGGQQMTKQEEEKKASDAWADFEKEQGSHGAIDGEFNEIN